MKIIHVDNPSNTTTTTEDLRLLKEGALQSATFNSAKFSSIATDEKGVIQIFNVGAERMLDYTAAEVLNKIIPADISDPQGVIARAKVLIQELETNIASGFEALVFKASRGIEDIYELTRLRKDGSRFMDRLTKFGKMLLVGHSWSTLAPRSPLRHCQIYRKPMRFQPRNGRLALVMALLVCCGKVAQAQLLINSITPAAVTNAPGTITTFSINYAWPSLTQAATGAVIAITVPNPVQNATAANITLVNNPQIASSSYNTTNQTITFQFVNPLPAGSAGTVQFSAFLRTDGTVGNGSSATFVATSSATGQPAYTNSASLSASGVTDNASLTESILGAGGATTNSILTYQLSPKNANPSLNITNWSMVDTLPPNVTYLSSSPAGVYNAGAGTVTWTSNSTPFNVSSTALIFTMQVVAPSSSFVVGNSLTNRVTTTNIFLDGATVTRSATNTVTLTAPAISFDSIAKASNSWNGQFNSPFTWTIAGRARGNDVANTFTITDTLPAAFVATAINPGFGDVNPTTVYIQYQTKNSPGWTSLPGSPFITTNSTSANSQAYSLTNLHLVSDIVTLVQWTYTSVTPLFTFQNSGDVKPTVTGTITNVDWNGVTVSPTASITNYASLGATRGTNLNLGTVSNYVTLSVAAPLISLTKSVTAGNNAQPGQTNTWTVSLNNAVTASDNLTNPVVADLLPLSLTYVAASASGNSARMTLTNTIVTSNYNGTGRTLLKFQYSGYLQPNTTVSPSFKTILNAGVIPGTTTNWTSLISWANAALNSSTPWVLDTNNLNGSGLTNLTYPTSSGNLISTIAAAVSSVQLVKGQLDSAFVGYPGFGSAYPAGPFSYQETISNPGNVALTNITVMDILPYVGDVGVLVTNQARGSAWQPFLTGPVSGPSGVTVYYSQSTNPYRPQIIPSGPPGSVNDWNTTAPADITTVRALKFVFGPTNKLNPLDAVQLTWAMQVPAGAPSNSFANNSFAYTATPAVTNSTAFISEPTMVGVKALAPQPIFLGDYVWNDANGNGIQDTGETGINNVRVELYQAGPSGIPGGSDAVFVQFALTANGPTGNPGYYQFTYLPAGNYFVKVISPANFGISPEYQGSDSTVYSSFDPTSGCSALLALFTGNINENLDCGLYHTDTGTVGNYAWIDRNGNGLQDEGSIDGLNGVTVQIYSVTSNTILYSTTSTAFDRFGNPGYYNFYGLPPGQYQLHFVPPTGDTFTTFEASGQSNTGNESEANANGWTSVFTVNSGDAQIGWDAGIILPSGPLSVGNMVWNDPKATSRYSLFGGGGGINNVIVSLYWDTDGNGVFTAATDQLLSSTLTTTLAGEPGNYSFNNLPAGNFVVVIDSINFQPGGVLYGLTNDPVWLPATNSLDNASKGTRLGAYVASTAFPLVAGTEPTTPNANMTLDFGFTSPTNLVSVGQTVFLDNNQNSKQDNGEPGIAGVSIRLWRLGASGVVGGNDAVLMASTNTDVNGNYLFTGLPPTNYFITLPTPPANAGAVSPLAYAANQFDGYNHGTQPNGYNTAVFGPSFNLANNDYTEDFGFFDSSGLVTIGNVIFFDANANGKQDAGEPGIAGAGLALAQIVSNTSNIVAYAMTDTNGMYLFDLQPPGTYSVVVLATNFQAGGTLSSLLSSPGMVLTNQYSLVTSDQSDHGIDDANPALNGIHSAPYYFDVSAAPSGQTPTSPTEAPLTNANLTIDFGFYQPVQAPLVFVPASPQVFNTTNVLSVTGGTGTGLVSFAVLSGPGVIVNGNQLWVTSGTGSIQVQAAKAADGVYYAATVTNVVTAAKAGQTINFPAITNPASTDTPSLSATASSGLIVSYAVLSGPAVFNGSQLTFSGTGQVSVAASQSGNSNYGSATSVTNTLTVTATAQSPLIFSPASPQVFNTTNVLGVTGGSGTGLVSYAVLSGPGVIVNGNQLRVTSGTGTIQVQATKAADALYAATNATGSVTAAKAGQTINFAAIADTASTETVSLSATASSGLAVSFALLSGPAVLNSSQLTFNGTGQVSVAASQAGSSNYALASAVTNTFSVRATAQSQLVFAPSPSQFYGTTNLLSVTGGSGSGAVSITVLSGPGVIVNGNQLWVTSGSGTIQVRATKAADALYAISTATAQVTAVPANVTVILGNLSATYDGSFKAPGVSTTPSGVAVTVSYNGSATPPINAGSYTVIATITDPNYAGSATNRLVIAPANAVVVLGNLSPIYSGNPLAASVITDPTNLATLVTYNLDTNAPTDAGSYAVAATIVDPNYSGSATNTLLINPATPVVTNWPVARAISYGQTLSNSILSGGDVSVEGNFSFVTPALAPAAGTGLQLVVFNPNDSTNYVALTNQISVTVNAISTAVTLGNLVQTYDGTAKAVTVTTTPNAVSLLLTYNGSANAPTNAGNYTVVAAITDPNYTGGATNLLVIAPASATVALSDLSPTYDGTAKAVSVGTTPSGVAMAVTYNGLTSPPTNAGSYTVVALSADDNWVGGATNTLVISKAPVMVVVNSSLNPGGYRDDVTFTASITDGTGTVQFLTNGSNFGYAIYIVDNSANTNLNTLPRGTNIVIAIYGGDSNYLGATNTILQVVTNHPPLTTNISCYRNGLTRWKIKVADLLTNATDPDGDALQLASVGLSANGITPVLLNGYVQYYNTNLVDDQFSCTINDGFGGTNSVRVTLAAAAQNEIVGQCKSLGVSDGRVTVQFAGIPGYRYHVQLSTNLMDWATLSTTNAPIAGLFQFLDTNPPQPAAFYRLMWNGN